MTHFDLAVRSEQLVTSMSKYILVEVVVAQHILRNSALLPQYLKAIRSILRFNKRKTSFLDLKNLQRKPFKKKIHFKAT